MGRQVIRGCAVLQRVGVSGIRRFLCQRQRGQHAGHIGVGSLVLGHMLNGSARLVQRPARQIAARQPGNGSDILGIGLRSGGKILRRATRISGIQALLCAHQQGFDGLGVWTVPGQTGNEILDLAFRQRPHETVHRLAVLEGIDGRDRLDLEPAGNLVVFVDIDLDQPHLAARLSHSMLDHRTQLAARPAPGRPEVDNDRNLFRRLDHIVHERRV